MCTQRAGIYTGCGCPRVHRAKRCCATAVASGVECSLVTEREPQIASSICMTHLLELRQASLLLAEFTGQLNLFPLEEIIDMAVMFDEDEDEDSERESPEVSEGEEEEEDDDEDDMGTTSGQED